MYASSVDYDRTPRSAVSDTGLHCLVMSHKKTSDVVLLFLEVKNIYFRHIIFPQCSSISSIKEVKPTFLGPLGLSQVKVPNISRIPARKPTTLLAKPSSNDMSSILGSNLLVASPFISRVCTVAFIWYKHTPTARHTP